MTTLAEIEEKTLSQVALDPSSGATRRLVAIWDGGYTSCVLPASGSLLIGRSTTAELRISSTSVSREHARIHVGPEPSVEDAGSSNGTRVDGQRLEAGQRVPLVPGQVIELGNALVVLQAHHELPPQTTRPSDKSADGKMARLHRLADLVATGTLSVILQGETGVGKEVMAKRIHERSPRSKQAFLKINCAAFSDSMVESELFGHERGAFTGAAQAKAGLLETASGGTVLLDEVAELSLAMQAKLLRAVGNAEVLRIGGLKPRTIDVRFIAATNGDFDELIARAAFRADLYFRLNGITLTVPPLRERRPEIAGLAAAFAAESSAALALPQAKLTNAACRWLEEQSWPGNIRQLRSTVERAVLLAVGRPIEIEHLQVDAEFSTGGLGGKNAANAPLVRSSAALPLDAGARSTAPVITGTNPGQRPEKLRVEVARLERERVVDAINRAGGNQTKAAELLGISRRALIHRLDAYGLPRPRKGS